MKYLKKLNSAGFFTYCKYIFSVVITLATYRVTKNIAYIGISLIELFCIFLITNLVLAYHKRIGTVLTFVLQILYDAQILVLYFSGTFTSWVMLTNLASIQDISGKAFQYISAIVIMLIFLLLPVKRVSIPSRVNGILIPVIAAIEVSLVYVLGGVYSPVCATFDLYSQYKAQSDLHKTVEALASVSLPAESASISEDESTSSDEFSLWHTDIKDSFEKPDTLSEQPNIIILFTEALSSDMAYDEREVMPNVKALSEECISFDNYYNHTFATYRALIGQLYSGHQLENMDENHLISICDILEKQGYDTAYINTEPLNEEFTEYVSLLTSETINLDTELCTNYGTVPDSIAYQKLFETALEKEENDSPFLLIMYTVGTHASFENASASFGDGSDPFLNRFHDADTAFGDFFENFKNSSLYDNTIIVLTADHACYTDEDYYGAYPGSDRECSECDEMPLLIYYKGVTPQVIDANGRNTLDFAPTILDLLDISDENYFLGSSLFGDADDASPLEYIFYSPTFKRSSADGSIRELTAEEDEMFEDVFTKYCALKIR